MNREPTFEQIDRVASELFAAQEFTALFWHAIDETEKNYWRHKARDAMLTKQAE